MKSNFIPKHTTESERFVSHTKSNKQKAIAFKEKREGIFAVGLLLIILTSMIIFSINQNIILNNLAIILFIISSVLLLKLSRPTKQF